MFGLGSPVASQSSLNGPVSGISINLGRCVVETNFGPKIFTMKINYY